MRVATAGFLHTAQTHIETFESLVHGLDATVRTRHLVDASLLADARSRGGVDADLRGRLLERLVEAADGAGAVLCTCSTIGEAAEGLAAQVGVPVLRVDRPMAEEAVRRGGRIAVVAAVDSTIAPTLRLLSAAAAAAGTRVDLRPAPCPRAWPLFEAGDLNAYLAVIEGHVRSLEGAADVIVLAQASMAPVADRRAAGPTPVLASPGPAAAALVRAIAGRGISVDRAPRRPIWSGR